MAADECGESVGFSKSVVGNILPGGFFAGQDIPELLDDSLLFVYFQHENTALTPDRVISFPSSKWRGACFYSCGEKNWTADSMQRVRVYGRKVRLSNLSPALWPTSARLDSRR
jgi:hypothetical protein